ncbi:hypothetical protein DS67_01510 [Mesotoga sp. SC_4PWA21]|nr:hypothetical protein DS67_01510 [Mesotoga sp. SC_4PWA21]
MLESFDEFGVPREKEICTRVTELVKSNDSRPDEVLKITGEFFIGRRDPWLIGPLLGRSTWISCNTVEPVDPDAPRETSSGKSGFGAKMSSL